MEPEIREALGRLREGVFSPATGAVGGYWMRTNDPEIDLVGADRAPIAKKITFVGSIQWLERRPFDTHDLGELIVHRAKLPGAESTTPLIAVSRSGSTIDGVTVVGPEELVAAYG